ncbi:MAG: DUF4340 domain-containing protein, partial [Polyangiaceae bacterium]|nr:DUF4340 domain-containing protein [Polyangiaceae bacterium]
MMDLRKNRLPLAIVLLAVLGGGTLWALSRRDAPSTSSEGASAELPTLERDSITTLEITRPGAETIRLEKAAGAWRITAPLESAVEESTVNTALDKLSSLEARGIAATREANHGALEVDAERGTHVIAFGGEEELANLWFGASRSGNTMVRLDGEKPVIAARGSLKYAFDKELKEWRDRRIVSEEPTNVRAVSFEFGGSALRFERGEGDAWVQSAGQAPIERFSSAKVQSIVASLARLRAVDFAQPNVEADAAGLTTPTAIVTLTIQAPAPTPAEGEPPATPAEPRMVVLRLGSAADGGNVYVQKDGEG